MIRRRKLLEIAAESPASGAPRQDGVHPISQKKQGRVEQSILRKWQTKKPYISIGETARLPWCTVVSDHDDLSTGGVVDDPD